MPDQSKLDHVVDAVAQLTGRNVSLDDVFSRVLAYNTSHPTRDRARIDSVLMKTVTEDARHWERENKLPTRSRPFILPANPDKGFLARVCIPLIAQGIRTGYLWVLALDEGDEPAPILEALDRDPARIEGYAFTVLEALEVDSREAAQGEDLLLRALAADGGVIPDWVQRWARGRPLRAAALSHPAIYRQEEGTALHRRVLRRSMAEALRAVPTPVLWGAFADHVALVHTAALTATELETLKRRMGQSLALHGFGGGAEIEAGLGGWGSGPEEGLSKGYRQAIVALQAAAVDQALPRTVDFTAVGVYQFLALNGALPASTRFRALEAAPNGDELLGTLERIYDFDGTRGELADALHIHRTSLYHRLRRAGSILGEDALSSAVRLDLQLAMKARKWRERPSFGLEAGLPRASSS